MEDEYIVSKGTREAKKKLRVTFPNGKVICYKSATVTFMEALRSIDIEELQKVDLQIGHLPIISQECYPKYKAYMKEFRKGWFVNTQSNTDQKYIQLKSISQQLGLGLVVEVGADFAVDQSKGFQKSRTKESLLVKFPDGNYIGEESPIQTFIACIEKIGIDAIRRKQVPMQGKELITLSQENKYQQQLSNGQWLNIPNTTKDKVKILKIISIMVGIKLEVTTI